MAAYFAWLPLALVLVAVVIRATVFRRSAGDARVDLSTAQAALLGVLALPVTLVVFSLVVQPALVDRYAFPAVAGLACLGAIAVARLPVRIQLLLLVGAVGLHARALRERAGSAATFDAGVRGRVRAANAIASDPRPVITTDRNVLYSVALSAANRNRHLSFLALPTDTIRRAFASLGARASADVFIVDRDGATAHHQIFDFPALLPLDSLRRVESFFALGYDATRPEFPFLYGGQLVCRVRPYIFLVSNAKAQRTTSGAPIRECATSDLAVGPPKLDRGATE
jgi:hypothetical protein